MKKTLWGLCGIALCASLLLTACGTAKKEEEEPVDEEETELEQLAEMLPEEEEVPEWEYEFAGAGATLIAYHGEAEEIDLTAPVIRVRTKKQTVEVTEEVTNEDGTVSTVTREEEQPVEVEEEYELIAVAAGAFMNNEHVKKIVLPDTVTEIGDAAFQGCTALEEVVLPKGLDKIGQLMFYGCDSLTTLEIPETVESIGLFAFGDYFKRVPWVSDAPAGDFIVGDGILLKHTGAETVLRYDDRVKSVAYYAFLDSPAEEIYFTKATESISELATYRSKARIMLPAGSALISELRTNNVAVGTYDAPDAPAVEEETAEEEAAETPEDGEEG